jgi:RNA polymerase sigma-70 factor (ECF subfamily)
MNLEDCKEIPDSQIKARILADPNFYYCVMRTYETQLKNYIRRLTNVSEDELDDILQEVFIRAYENINSYDDSFKFSSWLYRIAHNETISYWRKHRRRWEDVSLDVSEDFVETLKGEINLNEEIDQLLLKDKIQTAIDQLPFKYREVMVLRYLEDRDYQDIGDIIKKPINTVGTLINRAKKQLKEILSE